MDNTDDRVASSTQDFRILIAAREGRVRLVRCIAPPHFEEAVAPALRTAGWEVARACECRGLDTNCSTSAVGVLYLDRHNPALITQWEELQRSCSPSRWIALLAPKLLDDPQICELIEKRFYDYHTLPVDLGRLLATLGHAEGLQALERRVRSFRSPIRQEWGIVGSSKSVVQLLNNIRKVARVDAPVLITGESGTGKELAASAIHSASARANGPFVPVNCASLPPNLIQSELFGHEKGSFTGAHRKSIGRIEAAAGGTVFLDEIGDIPLDLQTSLLRFLQEKTIERVGGLKPFAVDVRVIAATNVDLERAVKEGRFRRDLFYRLNVFRLETPALRDRKEDIEQLVQFFFDMFAKDRNPQVKGFSSAALAVMREYDWPGNIRELFNRVRQAMVMSENSLISVQDLGLSSRTQIELTITPLDVARAAAERSAIAEALRYARNNVSEAAERLGITRSTIYRLMDRYGLNQAKARAAAAALYAPRD